MFKTIRLAGTFALILALALVSQTAAQSKADRNKTQADSKMYDMFLPKVLEMNAAEADLGWLGAEKAQNPRVREFTQMVADKHYETLENLGGLYHIAIAKKYTGVAKKDTFEVTREKPTPDSHRTDLTSQLPKEHQQLKARLSKLSGAAFDREIMKVMVERHQKGVEFFQTHQNAFGGGMSQTAGSKTGDVKAGFANLSRILLPVVQDHLRQAQEIQRELQTATNQGIR
jgi:predicted outer membrane protein